jgi:hypothetical protein
MAITTIERMAAGVPGKISPDGKAVSVTPLKQTLIAVFRALDGGSRSLRLPSGNVVSLHPRLVSVAAGLGRCKECGAAADIAVEIATGPGTATLWFVQRLDDGDWLPMTSDHLVPVSKGGATHEDNLRCMCRGCNMAKKADMMPGLEVEIRWCVSAVFDNIRRAHSSPKQPAPEGYRRFLSDRRNGKTPWFPPMGDWLDEERLTSLLARLRSQYGLVGAVSPNKLPFRAFPHVPKFTSDEVQRTHAAACEASMADAPSMAGP